MQPACQAGVSNDRGCSALRPRPLGDISVAHPCSFVSLRAAPAYPRTTTPLQRPEALADKTVLTPEAAAAYLTERHAGIARERDLQLNADWWTPRGLTNSRTSLIVDPRRIPQFCRTGYATAGQSRHGDPRDDECDWYPRPGTHGPASWRSHHSGQRRVRGEHDGGGLEPEARQLSMTSRTCNSSTWRGLGLCAGAIFTTLQYPSGLNVLAPRSSRVVRV